jgi:polysaccharide biosynthesis transport protein
VAIHMFPEPTPPKPERRRSLIEAAWQPSADSPSDRAWSVVDCARTLYRNRIPLFWITGCGILLAMLASSLQAPVYRSSASIQIQGVNDNFLSLRDVYPTAAPSADNAVYIQTQAEMLRQDALIEQVVKKLRLEERPQFRNGTSFRDRLFGGRRLSVAEQVKRHIQIVPVRGSSIVQIVSEAREPRLAADLANTLAQSFIDQSIEARQRSAMQTYLSLSLEGEALRKRIAELEDKLDSSPNLDSATRSYIALKQELDANRKFNENISRRADEARLASAVSQSNLRLVGPAQPPVHPQRPNSLLNLLAGALGGLTIGIGYVMLREQTNAVLRTPSEASAYLSVPELGAIPRARNPRRSWLVPVGAAFGNPLFDQGSLEPFSSGQLSSGQLSSDLSEYFHGTVASILAMSHNGDQPRILLVTSSRPMEGKTTVLSNLGIALAEIGKKVLLIDGDLRRPRLHKIFDQANSWGLSDLLREEDAIEDLPLDALVKRTMVPHLSLLPSGTTADNIFSLLWSGRMARLLPRFRQEFHYVLMDAPPCLEFADARIMGRYAENLLLVIRADYTQRKTAQAAVQRLLLDGIPVMGVIFNFWDPSKSDIYGDAHYRQGIA